MKRLALVAVAFAAAFINLIPLLLVVPAGDTVMNYAQVDCFSKQLWSGILYPRWCMDANGGMGSPLPIFYFPLPFYITAIFAPLKLSAEHQYLLGIFLANVTAFLCCVLWLSRIASCRIACFGAFIFLFGFYRAEMIARASYAEYWCIAFMPLIFHYARALCEKHWQSWPKLAFAIALCMFCHAPATLIGLMGAGLFVLLYSRCDWRTLAELALSCLLAAMIGAFHYLPMKTLVHTLNDEMGGVNHWRRSWVNSFVNQPQLYADHPWALIGSGVGLLATLFICAALWHKRCALPDNARRESLCWMMIAAFALCMMFSASAPLWRVVEALSGVATPWRMQALILFALIIAFAGLAEHVWFRDPHTRTGDMLLAAMFFIISSLFYSGGVDEKSVGTHKQLIPAQHILAYASPRDIDIRYKDVDRFFTDFIRRPNRQHAEWAAGSGALAVEGWDARGITVRGHADVAGTLRLEHFYYPIWQAALGGKLIPVTAEPFTGRMLLSIPQGDFTLRLTQHYWNMLPKYFWLTKLSALASLLIIGVGFWRLRRGCHLRA